MRQETYQETGEDIDRRQETAQKKTADIGQEKDKRDMELTFPCYDGSTIPLSSVWDKMADCGDSSDEKKWWVEKHLDLISPGTQDKGIVTY